MQLQGMLISLIGWYVQGAKQGVGIVKSGFWVELESDS